MPGIVKLHGTSGSGKTTVARVLLSMGLPETILEGRKPVAYKVTVPNLRLPLFILGPYTATCGGLDGISDSAKHIELLQQYAEEGHVFYEGLLGSEYYGKIGVFSERYGDRHLFMFLSTPIETCIERVKARRLKAGNTKPLNEENTRGRIKKIERLRERLHLELGRKVMTRPDGSAIEAIMEHYHAHD
jgi:energy-coupling factor transporter ATP-binding protein EcfA2